MNHSNSFENESPKVFKPSKALRTINKEADDIITRIKDNKFILLMTVCSFLEKKYLKAILKTYIMFFYFLKYFYCIWGLY